MPRPLGGFDKFLNGMAANGQYVKDFLSPLADLRNPMLTPMLAELEYDHGIPTNDALTEEERRIQLNTFLNVQNDGSPRALATALRLAGFDVYVYQNSSFGAPPVLYLTEQYQAYCGGADSYCGGEDAYCGVTGGILLVNGDLFKNTRHYTATCGDVSCGEENAFCGAYDLAAPELIIYPTPIDPTSWPFTFFVGGLATGGLGQIPSVSIPAHRRGHFEQIILRYKPMHTWAVLIVSYN